MRIRVFVPLLVLIATTASAQQSPWSIRFPGSNGPIKSISRSDRGDFFSTMYSNHSCVGFADAAGITTPVACFAVGIPHNVAAAPDGGFFLYGLRGAVPNETPSTWIARFDRDRRIEWTRNIEGNANVIVEVGSATADGGMVLVGGYGQLGERPCKKCQASFALKLARGGDVEWFHVFDVTNFEDLTAVRPLSDGYVIAGTTEPGAWIAKLDRRGTVIWRQWFSAADEIASVDALPNGDVVAAGTGKRGLYWIARVSSGGQIQWQKSAKRPVPAALHNLVVRRDGTFVAYGIESVNRLFAPVLIALNGNGEIQWQRQIRLPDEMYGGEMELGPDDGIIVSLWTQTFAELHRFSPDGQPPSCLAAATLTPDIQFEPVEARRVSPEVREPAATVRAVDDPVATIPVDMPVSLCEALARPVAAEAAPPVSAAERKVLETQERGEQDEKDLSNRVRQLLASRKFAELDRLGDELRRSRAMSYAGYPKLAIFYRETSSPAAEFGSEQQHLQLLEDWRKSNPDSVSAAVSQAAALIQYGWEARGSGFGDTVSGEGWKKFEALRQRAEAVVKNAPAAAVNDPEFHIARVNLAGQNCDNLEAVAYDPRLKPFAYHPLWRIAANYFLPRWCRNEDAERKFAEYAANSTKKTLGEGLYGFIAWDVFVKERGDRQKFGAYKFEWPRIRQGLFDLIERYPSALLFYHRLAFLAQYYDDRATARMLFEKPQLVWSSAATEIWGNRGSYEQARQWASVKPAEPFIARGAPQSSPSNAKAVDESTSWVAAAASKWPPLFLINRVRLSDGLEYFFNSFLVRSAKGVVAITALTKFGKEQSYMSNISRKPAVFVTPMPLTTFRAKMQEWTIYAPQKPELKISPALIEPKTNPENYEGVVVTFDPSTKLPPVRVLKRYESPPATEFPHSRVYVVACRPGQAPCQQAAFAGETKSGGVGSNGQRMFVFQLDDPVPWGELIGSPVINEDGNVIAVVTTPSEPVARASDETTFIAGEDVNSVLVRAGY